MTMQETLKGFIQRYKDRKQAVKDYEDNDRMVNNFNQKKLSHNERVLNKLMEQNRQKQISRQLEFELSRRKNEDKQQAKKLFGSHNKLWKDNSLMKTKNVFMNQKCILRSK